MSRDPTTSQRYRLFFAVDLASEVREAALAAAGKLRACMGEVPSQQIRWTRCEALHVTLCFLGEVDAALVPRLGELVSSELAGISPFSIRLGPVVMFPASRRPRVVALEVEPREPLAALAAAVERGKQRAGLAAEERPFRPHLTLGRVRSSHVRFQRLATSAGVPAPEASMLVSEVVLFRSELRCDGARYSALDRIELGISDHPSIDSTEDENHGSQKK